MNTPQLVEEVLIRGLDDWIQAAEVWGLVMEHRDASAEGDERPLAMETYQCLLEKRLMVAGDLTEQGFVPWPHSPADALRRIEQEWRRYPQGPSLGDVCWLSLTDGGRAQAEVVWARQCTAFLRSVFRGDVPASEIAGKGFSIARDSKRWHFPRPYAQKIPVASVDLLAGLKTVLRQPRSWMARFRRKKKAREWAEFILAADRLLDLDAVAREPGGATLLQAIRELSRGSLESAKRVLRTTGPGGGSDDQSAVHSDAG